jgi:alkaline phosphatase
MDDGLPLPTITYTNGPGWIGAYVVDENGNAARRNLTGDDVTSYDYVHSAGALRYSETHGGDDVALFAVGEKTSRCRGADEHSGIVVGLSRNICRRMSAWS